LENEILRRAAAFFVREILWVPEDRHTSWDLPIFMEEAAEPVVAVDAGEVGLAVFRGRAQGSGLRCSASATVRAIAVEVVLVLGHDRSSTATVIFG
jgi:hypothetical protein